VQSSSVLQFTTVTDSLKCVKLRTNRLWKFNHHHKHFNVA